MQQEPDLHADSDDDTNFDFEEMEFENDNFIIALDPKCPCALHGYRQPEKKKIPEDEYVSSDESVHEPKVNLVVPSEPLENNAPNLKVHENLLQYCCNECDAVFNTRQHLFIHRKVHPSTSTCKYCMKTFSKRSNLKRHLNFTCTNNLTRKIKGKLKTVSFTLPFICDYCKKGYSHKKTLLTHIRRHMKESHTNCSINNMNITTKEQVPNNKPKLKQYSCNECDDVYESRQDLIIHLKLAHSSKVICKYCKKSITKRTNLKRHQDYFCSKNKMKGCNNETLKYGMFSNRFTCDYCSKSYTHKSTLITHIKSHIGRKPKYQCHICDKNYTKRHNLNCHLQSVHYKTKQYSCKFCKEKFAWRAGVISHEKTHHKIEHG